MDTTTIQNAMEKNCVIAPFFNGVFPSDKIPCKEKIKSISCFIFNLDPAHLSGSHWIAIILRKGQKNIYFDSYGLPPKDKEMKRFMDDNFIYNNKQVQHPFTTTCGQWCMFTILMICLGESVKNIVSWFSKDNYLENDRAINCLIKNIFCVRTSVLNKDFLHEQTCDSFIHKYCKNKQ